MKRILIISFHSLPDDIVSSYRAKAYCDFFYKWNIYPTLLTTRWERDNQGNWIIHNPNDTSIIEKLNNYEVIRLPYLKPLKQETGNRRKAYNYNLFLNGHFDHEQINNFELYMNFLLEHLKLQNYDLLIGIYSPHFVLKLTYEVAKRFKIPYILDFRDLWDNRVASVRYKPTIREYLINTVIKFYWKKWLSKALFFSITSEYWKFLIQKFSRKEGVTIRNGFESLNTRKKNVEPKIFTLSYFGAIYYYQNITSFLEGVRLFIKEYKPVNFTIKFIGIKEKYRKGIIQEIESMIPSDNLKIVPYLPKEELMDMMLGTDLFFLPSIENIKGWCPVKLYDYLALLKPIIIYPGSADEIEDIINTTKSGYVINNQSEFINYLKYFYALKMNGKPIPFKGEKEEILKFSRELQVKKLAEKIIQFI